MIEAFCCQTSVQSRAWHLLGYAYGVVFGDPLPDIDKAPSGKPYFPAVPEVFFSVSHTEGAVLIVLSDSGCGCDVEVVRPERTRLAKRIACESELADFGFFEAWTLKESFVKLVGDVPKGDVYGFMKTSKFSWKGETIEGPDESARFRLYRIEPYCIAIACVEQEPPFELRVIPESLIVPCEDAFKGARNA